MSGRRPGIRLAAIGQRSTRKDPLSSLSVEGSGKRRPMDDCTECRRTGRPVAQYFEGMVNGPSCRAQPREIENLDAGRARYWWAQTGFLVVSHGDRLALPSHLVPCADAPLHSTVVMERVIVIRPATKPTIFQHAGRPWFDAHGYFCCDRISAQAR